MKSLPSTSSLAAENADLRARLAEAEETLRAIRSGEVDALVVSGPDGEHIYTLQNADYPYRLLIETMSEGALTMTRDGTIFYANQRFADMVKTPLNRVIGSALERWIIPADRGIIQGLQRQAHPPVRRYGEVTLWTGEETAVPCYLSLNPMEMEKEQGCFCLVVTDLTEQKRTEAIVAAEKLARSILEQATEAIIVCDHTGRIIRASEMAHALCGANPLGQPFEHMFRLQPTDGAAFSLAECVHTGQRHLIEADLDRQGSVLHLMVSIGPLLGQPGELLGSVVTLTNITELKQAKMEIQRFNAELEEHVRLRTAELEAANVEIESFAYAVSHDLRAPLRAMNGFSQALLEDYGATLTGEAQGYLNYIIEASHRMSALIDGLLRLSRSTRGGVHQEWVDLSALAESLLAELAATEPERRVTWQVEPALYLYGDSAMLEAVMRNLLGNAWKFTAKTPNATIQVYGKDQDGQRWCCVADNGAGFDMNHVNRLFQVFQRLHRQDEFPGLGIGLVTVQRIMQRHGGVIRAEGALGRGATFYFALPSPLSS